jgi:hypothetical protein
LDGIYFAARGTGVTSGLYLVINKQPAGLSCDRLYLDCYLLFLSFICFLATSAITPKRTRETDQVEHRDSLGGPLRGTTSLAPKLNAQVLKRLHRELDANPEVDSISKFPTDLF